MTDRRWTLEQMDQRVKEIEDFQNSLPKHLQHRQVDDLLSMIRQLREPQWISVEDRFPSRAGEVLVCENSLEGAVDIAMFDGYDEPGGFDSTFEPTHWMPLPDPPKESR